MVKFYAPLRPVPFSSITRKSGEVDHGVAMYVIRFRSPFYWAALAYALKMDERKEKIKEDMKK
ncbi:MAG: hypothetical protein JRN32_02390 [Nitrososphaerota archaeon]|jgi:hypothetical protein|nr:hypothetical protein [Nitrososphaerota archaeon]